MAGVFPTVIGSGTSAPVNSQTIESLFNAESVGITATGQSEAEALEAQGAGKEEAAYQNAAAVANANAQMALVAGSTELAQQQLQVRQSIGQASAQIAGGGFGASGSAASLLRASAQQGALGGQIIQVNAGEQAGGYYGQAAASEAEAAAAGAAEAQANALSESEASLASKANSLVSTESSMMGVNPTTGQSNANPFGGSQFTWHMGY